MNQRRTGRIGIRQISLQAMVAAIYTALTLLLQPISFGPLQCRISEALTVLPFLFPSTVWGLSVGCFVSNVIGGTGPLDVIFGTLATAAAGFCTAKVSSKWLAPLWPVVFNALIIGAVLAKTVSQPAFASAFPLFALEVGIGEAVSCFGLGLPLLLLLRKSPSLRRFLGE